MTTSDGEILAAIPQELVDRIMSLLVTLIDLENCMAEEVGEEKCTHCEAQRCNVELYRCAGPAGE